MDGLLLTQVFWRNHADVASGRNAMVAGHDRALRFGVIGESAAESTWSLKAAVYVPRRLPLDVCHPDPA